MTKLHFTKGHGTHNDFVLVADLDGTLDLSAQQVRLLADRRGGIGADGVIRLAPAAAMPAGEESMAPDPAAQWFMDYRNADGSLAEMCGNGVRVTAAFAASLGLVDFDTGGEFVLGTRAGSKRVRRVSKHTLHQDRSGQDEALTWQDATIGAADWYSVEMGLWSVPGGRNAMADGSDAAVVVRGWTTPRPALRMDTGNPHTVVALGSPEELAGLDLSRPPLVHPEPPDGTNVEFVLPLGESADTGRIRMRVYERGVGETLSCGTGAVAAALAVRVWAGTAGGDPVDTWYVDVPGGLLRVRVLPDGHTELAGPAELVYSGEIDL